MQTTTTEQQGMRGTVRTSRLKARLVLACTLLIALLAGARAAAQDDEPPGYREAIEQAVSEFAAHHIAEARALFARAHALMPNARTHRGLGLAEFELRNYGACIEQLEAALRADARRLEGALREDTEEVLARANDFVARFVIDARPSPSRLVIDGVTVDVPPGRALVLQVGEHTLELSAPGYEPERRHLSIRGGESETLLVLFSKPRREATPARTPRRRWVKSPWLWSAVGLAVAGAAAGTAIALTRDEGGRDASYAGTSGVTLGASERRDEPADARTHMDVAAARARRGVRRGRSHDRPHPGDGRRRSERPHLARGGARLAAREPCPNRRCAAE